MFPSPYYSPHYFAGGYFPRHALGQVLRQGVDHLFQALTRVRQVVMPGRSILLAVQAPLRFFTTTARRRGFSATMQVARVLAPCRTVLVRPDTPRLWHAGPHAMEGTRQYGVAPVPSVRVPEYWTMRDQTGTQWYWWFNSLGELARDTEPPGFSCRALTQGSVPSWHRVTDEAGGVWYQWPDELGQLAVDILPPPLGTGLLFGLVPLDGITATGELGWHTYRLASTTLGEPCILTLIGAGEGVSWRWFIPDSHGVRAVVASRRRVVAGAHPERWPGGHEERG